MANTFYKIATVTVGSGGASSIDFSSIPSTYTDLCLKFSVRNSQAANSTQMFLKINSTDGTSIVLRGNGATASSFSDASLIENGRATADSATASTFSNGEFYIPNYTNATNKKSISSDVVSENNGTTAYVELTAGLSTSTSAITALSINFGGSGNFMQYSIATLYGISNS